LFFIIIFSFHFRRESGVFVTSDGGLLMDRLLGVETSSQHQQQHPTTTTNEKARRRRRAGEEEGGGIRVSESLKGVWTLII